MYLYIQVNVETLENMFTVNVESEQNCPGLLLTIIQVFEELGLDVLNAEAACNHGFELAAHGVWVCICFHTIFFLLRKVKLFSFFFVFGHLIFKYNYMPIYLSYAH